jgi:micrococcal nuclease
MKSQNHYYEDNVYIAKVLRVIDGDTVHLLVDMGLRVYREVYLRLADINAPELRRGTEEERAAGKASMEALEGFLDGWSQVGATSQLFVKFKKGKSFDRWVGILYYKEEGKDLISINDWMVSEGHAVKV